MTNIDRTAEHLDSLDRLYAYASGNEPSNAERAQALADAGYLMPDLPEPVADEVGELEWGGIARWEPDGSLHVTDDLYGKTSPHYLRANALALLAAADYAERNQE